MMKFSAEQKQIYSQQFNHFQQFGLQMLSMTCYEIDQVIHEMIESNPAVEYEEVSDSFYFNSDFNIDQVACSISLYDDLIQQMKDNSFPYKRNIVDIIYLNLDHHGFLSLKRRNELIQMGLDSEKLHEHISFFQQCEPQGIACADILDFMCIQLKEDTKENYVAREILKNHLDLLKYHLYEEIAKRCRCDEYTVQMAISILKECEKFPIEKSDSGMELVDVSLSYDYKWNIKIRQPRYAIKASSLCNCYELQPYVKGYMNEINKLNHALKMRNQTMDSIIRHILQKNQDFFLINSAISPMTMTKCASDLHMHKSTVSRAVANKYLEYQGVVYPLKQFFSRDTLSSNKSDKEVKRMIYTIFQQETKILKDDEVCGLLQNNYKISISRRTVSKYRNNLGIDGYNQRKRVKENGR